MSKTAEKILTGKPRKKKAQMSNGSFYILLWKCKLDFHKEAQKQGFYTEIQTVSEYMKNYN
jgi:hypothetical protein